MTAVCSEKIRSFTDLRLGGDRKGVGAEIVWLKWARSFLQFSAPNGKFQTFIVLYQRRENTFYRKQTLKAASVSSINTTFNAQSLLTLGGGAKTAASMRLVAWPRVWGRALPTRLKAEKWSTRTETELESTWHWSPRWSPREPWSATFFHSDGWPVKHQW